jgi:hypothetical protein
MLQRGGRLIIMPVEKTKRIILEPNIHANIRRGTNVMTDGWWAYTKRSSH